MSISYKGCFSAARPGDELKVEQCVKDLRSLSLPNMKPSGEGSVYILTPGSERAEQGSLPRREGVDILVSDAAASCVQPLMPFKSQYLIN